MIDILEYYQNIPMHIDPIAFTVGSFTVGWYALMYIVGFLVVYLLLKYRIKHDIGGDKHSNFQNLVFDFLVIALFGAIIGGRLGYVLLYNPLYYWQNLLEIVSPYDFATGRFIGIYGMSYHGGLLGVILASLIFTRKNKINFWVWADFVVPAVPAGYFFGRIGNFLNAELYGRVTNGFWGMHFPTAIDAGELLRFPSQLSEAFLEGIILFAILWSIRNKKRFKGYFLAIYLMGYGVVRFLGEFFREPDGHIGYILHYFTWGQVFSVFLILAGIILCYSQKAKKVV